MENLEEEEQYPFFVWLIHHFPDLDMDWLLVFHQFQSALIKNGKIEEVLSFVESYKQKNLREYSQQFQFIERDICDYLFYKKDVERLKERVAFIQQYPIEALDTLTIRLLYQLIFHGYYDLAVSYSQAIWKTLYDSDELFGLPEYYFVNTNYVSKLQETYEAYLKGTPMDVDSFFLQMESIGIQDEKSTFEIIMQVLREDSSKNIIEDSFKADKNDLMLILNIQFLKYMLHTHQLPFVFSEWIWNFFPTTKIFCKKKDTEKGFYVSAKTLDEYIAKEFDSFLGTNELEVFGEVWGLDFVFEFFHKHQLLSDEHYKEMLENTHYFRNEMMRILENDLWQMKFVFDWPKTDPSLVDLSIKSLFEETFELQNSDAIEKIRIHTSFDTIPKRIRKELKIKDDIEKYLAPLQAEIESYINEELNIGRNEPCPCGSGKKYKKCCMNDT